MAVFLLWDLVLVLSLCVRQKNVSNLLLSSALSGSVAAVKDIDRFQQKISASLHPASLSPDLEHIKLGVITREELPVHYR